MCGDVLVKPDFLVLNILSVNCKNVSREYSLEIHLSPDTVCISLAVQKSYLPNDCLCFLLDYPRTPEVHKNRKDLLI